MNAPAVRAQNLVRRFGDLTAVDGLSFDVQAGECFGMLGPNGAGKTTTVEMLEGLGIPDSGQVEILGQSYSSARAARELRAQIGVQLQQTELSDRLTVVEILQQFRSFYKQGRSVHALLQLMALEEKSDARVMTLSGGQKQRLALACALAGDPKILFLDEPSTGLDPQARLKVWEVVETFRAGGGTVVLTTHYMEEAERLCDRVAIIDHGRIIALDAPGALIRSLGAEQIVEFESTGAELTAEVLSGLPAATEARARGRSWAVGSERLNETLPALLALVGSLGGQVDSLRTHQPSLEDVFVKLTGRELRDG